MVDPRFSPKRMALRAFDLSERGVRRGRASQQKRVQRWRTRLWMIAQCALAAGIAWWFAHDVLGHQQPIFAAVAAVVCLGFSFGQRLSRAVEVSVGVALGVFFGDVFVALFGAGPWQIVVVCFLSMSVATWVGARNLMIIQAGVQATVVMTLATQASAGFSRWLDAIVGCVLALVITTFAPASSLVRPRLLAAGVLTECADLLGALKEALRDRNPEDGDKLLERARASDSSLDELTEATDEGMAVVRYSPFLRHRLPQMTELSLLTTPLDRMVRNLRVLARRTAVALWRDEDIPLTYQSLLGELEEQMRFCAGELYERRLPTAARQRILAIGEQSAHLRLANSLSAVVMLAQMRSMMADLLCLTGMDYADAREAIPDME